MRLWNQGGGGPKEFENHYLIDYHEINSNGDRTNENYKFFKLDCFQLTAWSKVLLE
jgi:hypothetical protein